MTSFVHLRVHTAYSLAEGAIKIPKLLSLAKDYAMPAVAVTDTGNLFGALEFSLAARDQGIQPILGCQIQLAPDQTGLSKSHDLPPPDSLVLLVQSQEGYQNLLKIVTHSFVTRGSDEGLPPMVSLDYLKDLTSGLIALTGGASGRLGRLLSSRETESQALPFLQTLKSLFPDRLYIELQRYGLPEEHVLEDKFLALADLENVPMVATNESFFPTPDMYAAHDAFLCISGGHFVTETNRKKLTPHHYFKTGEEMQVLFQDLPEAIENTVNIAKRCHFLLKACKPLLPAFPTQEGRSETEEFRHQAAVGLERRLKNQVYTEDMSEDLKEEIRQKYQSRLDYEIGIIERMGFPGYYLIMADVIQWSKSQGIPVGPGRGSGAGSLAAWVLTITDIDPIRFKLIFERFLNPERVSMPDFDVDFCQERRDEVISYVQTRYGTERVAHIITFSKLQARAALRDVGRVLEMPYGFIDRICKLIPNNPANPVTLKEALEVEPQLQEMVNEDPDVARLMDISQRLEGLYRQASTHAAGVVIGDRPLNELVPLYQDAKSTIPATQFNMKYVEMAGLVKFDFLGLKTLTVLAHTAKIIEKTKGIHIDFPTIPLDDPKTFELLSRVEVVGVFQLESGGMRDVLRKLKPTQFEELIALVALYRPGPMDDIPRYLACRSGEEALTYAHPLLENILKETFGVMVYQEQVMEIAQVLGGYTLGAADLLRRAMGKKIKSEMDAQRKIFVDGAKAKDIDGVVASLIFDQMAKFAGYGFNKSHAAPYALISYHTAYLKANHPEAFMAAAMNLDLNNTDELNNFARELNRMEIDLLPPDINVSEAVFTVEPYNGKTAVRYGLAAIKNVGLGAMESLVQERQKNGPFRDLEDFVARMDHHSLNKRQLEPLIAAGALDGLGLTRKTLYMGVESILKSSSQLAAQRLSQQKSLFQEMLKPNISLKTELEWHPLEKLQYEFSALGFYLSSHPLNVYGDTLKKIGVRTYRSIQESPPKVQESTGSRKKDWSKKYPIAILGAVLLTKQERSTKTGQKYAFLQLSDTSGAFEVAVFSETLSKTRDLLIPGKTLLLTCAVQEGEDSLRLTADAIEDLDNALNRTSKGLRLFIEPGFQPDVLKAALTPYMASSGGIIQVLPKAPTPITMTLPGYFSLSAGLRAQIAELPGIQSVEEL